MSNQPTVVENYVTSEAGHRSVDAVVSVMRAAIESGAMVEQDMTPLNWFTPGLYIRGVRMKAGSLWVSKIHLERHPYFVLSGHARVWIDGTGWQDIKAPLFDITEPGTRRVLWMVEDTFWITVHHNPTDTQDLQEIEARIIEARELPEAMPEEAFAQFLEAINSKEIEQ